MKKNIIITGAGRGIGRATALLAASQGNQVYAISRTIDDLKGIEITRLGKRHAAEPAIKGEGGNKETLFWIGAAGEPNDGGPGTDFNAVKNKIVSITPIHGDLTDHKNMQIMKEWIKE